MELFILFLLIFLGIVMLVVEVALIPGFGITGIIGGASLMAAVVYAFIAIGTLAGWFTLLGSLLLCVLLIYWAVYGKSLDRMALKETIESSVADPNVATLSAGMRGVTITRLASIGNVDFDGKIVEATVRNGNFIDADENVEIVLIEEGTVYVKKV
ncbi:MAG: nodulation efficiency protein D (NfeD) [Bacteroidaceae bacterium]|nr:nodulation efficiency protein D (NfeD) [Bacteroidaceae bacterium]